MKFFKFLPLALLPITAYAVPTAEPEPNAIDFHTLNERALDLSSLLGDLTQSLGAIQDLLSPDSLNNINTLVTNAALLLSQPTANQTKSLIGTASDLLGSDTLGNLLDQLPTLLDSVSGLATPALITNVTDLLGNAHDLLTPQFVSNTKGLINDVAPLVSAISQVISALLSSILG
ncbi:hypothetical protein BDV59DRAFT_203100 [Aspergillus ambiguus]|uniref:uncharacterized protein n=1 Tax=Aspergillus ambiguus TaxID=176160 RepID=UPI003CCD211D